MASTATTLPATVGGRILSGNSKGLLAGVAVSVIVVIAVSFAISFTALVELAVMARIPTLVAWGWPVVVDGTMVVATFGTVLLASRTSRIVRAYPWLVLLTFGALSIYANGIHSVGGQISDAEAFVVGAVAPLALLASTHLLVVMLHSPVPDVTDEEIARQLRKAAKAAAADQSTPSAAASSPTAATSTPAPAAATMSREEAVTAVIAHRVEHGDWPTGPIVGAWVGKTAKTGVRIIADAKERYAAEQSPRLVA